MRARASSLLLIVAGAACTALPSSQPASTPADSSAVAPPSMPEQPASAAPPVDTPIETPVEMSTPKPERTRSVAGGSTHTPRPPRTPRGETTTFTEREPPTPRPTRTPKPKRTVFQQPTPDLSGPVDATTPEPAETKVAMATANDEPPVLSSAGGSAEMSLPAGTKPLALSKVRVSQTDEGLVLELDVTGDVPRHRVFRLQNPGRIVVDLEETEVPGGSAGPKAATSPVKEIKASEMGGASGNQVARVQFILESDATLAMKPSEEVAGHTLRVSFKPKH